MKLNIVSKTEMKNKFPVSVIRRCPYQMSDGAADAEGIDFELET